MTRPLRLHLPGGFYHVTLRGNHREAIFRTETDRLLLNKIVEHALAAHGARLHAYCWMTNHLHALVQIGDDPLANLMRRIAAGYARAFQRNRETTGHLFEKRYFAVLVDAESYLLELLRYIHLNPVRAGMVSGVSHYRWTSHHMYCGAGVDAWVTTDFALRMFAAERAKAIVAYRKFVACDAHALASPFEQIRGEQVLGSDDFKARLQSRLGLPIAPRMSLDALIAECCEHFNITETLLKSKLRHDRIVEARAWIARRARTGRIASLAELGRKLGCEPKTLRLAMARHGGEKVEPG
jgi:REP-associated tyrosine transposase